MASNDIGDWYRSIPLVTKYWFTGSVVLPLLGRFGLVSLRSLLLDYDSLIYGFQIWRPVTALFAYPLMPQTGFHFLLNLYFLYSYSTRLETGVFDGKPADYLFLLTFNWVCLVFLMDPMILSVLYIWCQVNRDQIVQFWFGTQFKAMYLPWVLFAFNMILGSGGWHQLLGILVGHLYFFLMFKYPQDFGGRQFLHTPSIFYRFLPSRRGGVAGFGMAPASQRTRDQNDRRHDWGRGLQLGGN